MSTATAKIVCAVGNGACVVILAYIPLFVQQDHWWWLRSKLFFTALVLLAIGFLILQYHFQRKEDAERDRQQAERDAARDRAQAERDAARDRVALETNTNVLALLKRGPAEPQATTLGGLQAAANRSALSPDEKSDLELLLEIQKGLQRIIELGKPAKKEAA